MSGQYTNGEIKCPLIPQAEKWRDFPDRMETLVKEHTEALQSLKEVISSLNENLIAPATNKNKVDIEFVRMNNRSYALLITGLVILLGFLVARISNIETELTPTSIHTSFPKSNENLGTNSQGIPRESVKP